jgi:eukaryotic-like serine/threonine-protein kinase
LATAIRPVTLIKGQRIENVPYPGSATPPEPPMSDFIDADSLGCGGYGEVLVCERERRKYAKKRLLPTALPADEKRFQREVRILSKLDHPNIVKVIAYNITHKPFWYVMPLYKHSLEMILHEIRAKEERIKKVFPAILDGVEYAHNEGVVHRDLKPGNVLLNRDDVVAVSDFGLGRQMDAESTRQTQSGFGMGTLFYMAPEQASDAKNADPLSDIFSLGCLLYTLYTGPLTSYHVDLAKLPPHIRVLVAKCTNPVPEKRYSSLAELKFAWRITVGDLALTPSTERADQIIRSFMAGNIPPFTHIDEFCDILLRELEDDTFIHNTIMAAPLELLKLMIQFRLADASTIFATFATITSSESWGFSYVDKIAARCHEIYSMAQDYGIKADMLYCMTVVGFSHNRYNVMDSVRHILEKGLRPGLDLAYVDRIAIAHEAVLHDLANGVSLPELNAPVREFLSKHLRDERY